MQGDALQAHSEVADHPAAQEEDVDAELEALAQEADVDAELQALAQVRHWHSWPGFSLMQICLLSIRLILNAGTLLQAEEGDAGGAAAENAEADKVWQLSSPLSIARLQSSLRIALRLTLCNL